MTNSGPPPPPVRNTRPTWANTAPGPLGYCHPCMVEHFTRKADANGHPAPAPRAAIVLVPKLELLSPAPGLPKIPGMIVLGSCYDHLNPVRASSLLEAPGGTVLP